MHQGESGDICKGAARNRGWSEKLAGAPYRWLVRCSPPDVRAVGREAAGYRSPTISTPVAAFYRGLSDRKKSLALAPIRQARCSPLSGFSCTRRCRLEGERRLAALQLLRTQPSPFG